MAMVREGGGEDGGLSTDTIAEADFDQYVQDLAQNLSQGHEPLIGQILAFLVQVRDMEEGQASSQIEPMEFERGNEIERVEVMMNVQKGGGLYQVQHGAQVSYFPAGEPADDGWEQYTQQAIAAGQGNNSAGRAPVEVDDGPGLDSFLADGALAKEYHNVATELGLKTNQLVERSLVESAESGTGLLCLDAPGNHPFVFKTRLGDEDMKVFARVFEPPIAYLSRIDLAYNVLTDAGVTTLAQGLLGARALRLESLSLRGNSIGPRGCDALTRALRNCESMRRLDLAQNPLGRTGGLMVVELLQEMVGLFELYLADTQIDIDVLVAMSAVLLTGTSRLQVADVEKPMILTLQEEHTVHIGRMLRVNVHLREVYLGKHRMRDDGVRQLVSFLLENKTLRVVDLRCNELGAEGARHLGKLLGADCQLTRLNLEGNRIGEKANVDGAKAFAEALLQNRMLTSLNLNNNGLCGEALSLLGDAMDQNSTLETVELFHSNWDQPSSYKFHQIFNDRARIQPLRADFITSEVNLRIDVCQLQGFKG